MALSGTLNFISASEYGVGYTEAGGVVLDKDYTGSFGATNSAGVYGFGTYGFIPIDFVGMNTVIHEPFTSSDGQLGYSNYLPMSGGADSPGSAYAPLPDLRYNFARVPSPKINTINDPAVLFNALMLHRNGAYGYPSWKQVRTGEHPIARWQRKNGAFSIMLPAQRPKTQYSHQKGDEPSEIITPQSVEYTTKRINFREPSIISAYHPMKHDIEFYDGDKEEQATMIHS